MPNGMWLTNEEIEACFRTLGLRFLAGPQQGTWVLHFSDPEQGAGELVVIDNGLCNQGMIGVHIMLFKARKNLNCVHKALSLGNGRLALAKFSMDGEGDIEVRAVLFRHRDMFHCQMLRHALGAVLTAATFMRPVLQCCLQNDNCDVETVFNRRLEEVSHQG